MFFLLRTAFWLTLVLVLIPLGSEKTGEPDTAVDPVAAFAAAQATMSDLGGFCGRNPHACQTGGEALAAIGARARDGARIVYEFLDDQVVENNAGLDPATDETSGLITGSTSSGTLTPQDLAMPWQGHLAPTLTPDTEIGPVPRPNPRAG